MKRFFAILLLLCLLTGCASLPATTAAPAPTDLSVHFLDVGQADCALLSYQGQHILIDGGNVDDSRLVVSYLQSQGITQLDLVVSTHPHEDHVGGLSGVLAVFETSRVWTSTTTHASKCFDDFLRYADQQGITPEIPAPGQTLSLRGGLKITVLGPVKTYPELNDTSLVLLVQLGSIRFLFTGDMTQTAEADLLASGAELKADVLKVGHHGSYSSTGAAFLQAVAPRYGVISLSSDNPYGYPHKEPMARLQGAGVAVYRTDTQGTVVARTDGKSLSFSWSDFVPEAAAYIGNKNSRVLHLPTCDSLPSSKNQVSFLSYDDALAAGYRPCPRCLPQP